MKYSNITVAKQSLDPHEAADFLGSEALLEAYLDAGWLKAYVKINRCTRYDLDDLKGCIARHKGIDPSTPLDSLAAAA